jgi:hypothetical protein
MIASVFVVLFTSTIYFVALAATPPPANKQINYKKEMRS